MHIFDQGETVVYYSSWYHSTLYLILMYMSTYMYIIILYASVYDNNNYAKCECKQILEM